MRYALCFFGLIRSFERTFEKILETFPINNTDILDIFITTSNYNNFKYRFKLVSDEILDLDKLKEKITNIVGDKLKGLNFLGKETKRNEKIINLLTNVENFQKENNFRYDKIILTRMDLIFVNWEIANEYYKDREEHEKGLLYLDNFNFPIGLKTHGCSCIPELPDKVTTIDLSIELKDNEMICYEDYWIGTVGIDFLIFNSNSLHYIVDFYKNLSNINPPKTKLDILLSQKKKKEIKLLKNISLQSYSYLNQKWWELENMCTSKIEVKMKFFFEENNIILKQLRFMQDIAVLIIR